MSLLVCRLILAGLVTILERKIPAVTNLDRIENKFHTSSLGEGTVERITIHNIIDALSRETIANKLIILNREIGKTVPEFIERFVPKHIKDVILYHGKTKDSIVNLTSLKRLHERAGG